MRFKHSLRYGIIQLTAPWGFSVTDYIEYYAYVTYLAQTISIFTTIVMLLS
jgi:hypothetical protein